MNEHILVAGLQYGDEGKGRVVDDLCRQWKMPTAVIRFSGGPQAAHNVVANGVHHTFSQFGSGALAGAPTHLSEHMLVNPLNLMKERDSLWPKIGRDPLNGLTVSEECLVVTPLHVAKNHNDAQTLEHGSTGMGIHATMRHAIDYPDEAIRMYDLDEYDRLSWKIEQVARRLGLTGSYWSDRIDQMTQDYVRIARQLRIVPSDYLGRLLNQGSCIFEGAQGVLLDQDHGFFPHVTFSTTTFKNAEDLLDEYAPDDESIRIGVTRSYSTRHGAGPFVAESQLMHKTHKELHNKDDGTQGAWRVGPLDAVALRYAKSIVGHLDGVVMTHVDSLETIYINSYIDPTGKEVLDIPSNMLHEDRLEWLNACSPKASYHGMQFVTKKALDAPIIGRTYGPDASQGFYAMSKLKNRVSA